MAIENPSRWSWRLNGILDKIILHAGTLESFASLYDILQMVHPDECYYLAAQSFVSYSFEDEYSTMNTNVNGTHYLLSTLHNVCPEHRF